MEKIYWKKLSGFQKFIFCLGWISALNLVFWIVMVIYYFAAREKRFWTPGSFRVIYIFGWINFIGIILSILLVLILMPWFAIKMATG